MLARSLYIFIIAALAVFTAPAPSVAAESSCPAMFDHKFANLMDEPVSLCQFSGKVVLIVNTASECGFTPQYKGLEALYQKLHGKGLEILGFPCNQFGAQEPGSEKEIANFCEVNYGVSFPMFGKSGVAKGTINPFYEKLAQVSGSRPRWNFHKYLVDRKGEKVLAYESTVTPGDPKFVREIERLLAQP